MENSSYLIKQSEVTFNKTMTNEEIIRKEANNFFYKESLDLDRTSKLNCYVFALFPRSYRIQVFRRLENFTSPEHKAIFLDELKTLMSKENNDIHKNVKTPNKETLLSNTEISLFYVQQLIDELPTVVTIPKITQTKQERKSIFVSYCHVDANVVKSFKRHFVPLEKEHNINLWIDTKIEPGQKWEEEINNAMKKAKIAIFVVSADFLASDFITRKEVPELLNAVENEGTKVLTIISSPCDFEHSALAKYQAMNTPTNPISNMKKHRREELYTSLVHQVRKILELN